MPSACGLLFLFLLPLATPIDWDKGRVWAVGSGPPNLQTSSAELARKSAEKSAQVDADRNLLENTKRIRLDDMRTLADELKDSAGRARFEKWFARRQVSSVRHFSDHGMELELELPLALLNEWGPSKAPASCQVRNGRQAEAVVLDARAVSFREMLFPRLVSATGSLLYGVECMSGQARAQQLAASFVHSVKQAKQKARGRVLWLKVREAKGAELRLDEASEKSLMESDFSFAFSGRVVILLPPPLVGGE